MEQQRASQVIVDGKAYRVCGRLDRDLLAVWDEQEDMGRVLRRDTADRPWRLWRPKGGIARED